MENFIKNFWYVWIAVILTAVLDLIMLPKLNIGAGFILAVFLLGGFVIWNYFFKTKK